jgi:hypothetical protein
VLAACALAPTLTLPGTLAASPAASSPIGGNLSGPGLVASSDNTTFFLNATGGPAFLAGTQEGPINWTATLTGVNVTGVAVSPSSGSITSSTHQPVTMRVTTNALPQTMTLTVKVVSTSAANASINATANFTRTFRVVVPYVLRATLVAGPSAIVLPFNVTVALDGNVVGAVAVPRIAANATYALVYRYPTTGLGSGYHTFTLAIGNPHGLVTFGNGATVMATTFYVAPSPANDTIWYVVGFVAFFGVLFIYATRVAARRRGPARR